MTLGYKNYARHWWPWRGTFAPMPWDRSQGARRDMGAAAAMMVAQGAFNVGLLASGWLPFVISHGDLLQSDWGLFSYGSDPG